MLVHLILFQRALKLSLSFFVVFCLLSLGHFHYPDFQFTNLFLCVIYSTTDSFYCIFYLSCCILQFSFVFLIFSNSFLILSLCSSILLLSSVSIFMNITLSYLLGRLHIFTWLISSSAVLSISFIWSILLCHLVLPNSLCLFLCIRQVIHVS